MVLSAPKVICPIQVPPTVAFKVPPFSVSDSLKSLESEPELELALNSRVAPLAMVVLPVFAPKEPGLAIERVPAETVVVPV